MWTPGWLPDTSTLRWSLANDLRIEGVRVGWHDSYEASDAATILEGYVAEDELGDVVEVTQAGVSVRGNEYLGSAGAATLARLDPPS